MVEQYLNNRLIVLYITPFILGLLTVFSFQPFNFSILNFFVLPIFFYLIVFIKKNLKAHTEKNHIGKIFLYLEQFLDLVFF